LTPNAVAIPKLIALDPAQHLQPPKGEEGEALLGEQTKIEWCDHTFKPWIGCSKVSIGLRSLPRRGAGEALWLGEVGSR